MGKKPFRKSVESLGEDKTKKAFREEKGVAGCLNE